MSLKRATTAPASLSRNHLNYLQSRFSNKYHKVMRNLTKNNLLKKSIVRNNKTKKTIVRNNKTKKIR